ncbi:hypothetical protein ACFWMX_32080 [Streptomyces sp. NPDC058378]|uniref:MmyB family transcriptional regulator n=1 Tax=unclassified Streptomyces TaxID=2593676 RepID=UPI003646E909
MRTARLRSSEGQGKPQGRAGVSERIIEGIAQALQLDEAECMHLKDLLRGAGTTRPPRRRPAQQRARPAVQRALDSMTGTPAFVLSARGEILATNDLSCSASCQLFLQAPGVSSART